MATIAEHLAALAITDNLNRVENPIAGEWKLLKPGVAKGNCNTTSGGGWRCTTSFTTGPDGCYWGKESFSTSGGKGIAGLFRITRVPSINERQTGVWVCRDPTTPETVQSGYYLRLEWKGSAKIKFTLEKWVTGTPEVMTSLETTDYVVGSRIAIVVAEGKVMMFASKEATSEFVERLSVADSTYTSGYSALMGRGTGEFIVRDFATGTFVLKEPDPPEAVTGAASNISHKSAVLNGTVDPNDADTDYYFEYGTTESYGTKVPVGEDGAAGEGSAPVAVDEGISGLTPETLYHFRLVAVNSEGEDKGADETFTTDPEPEGETVTMMIGGEAVECARWTKVNGELV